jgi:hypothetical protein
MQAITKSMGGSLAERTNTVLLLGILWGGLAVCVLGPLSY